MKRLHRRTLLRGACGVALGLPLLQIMGERRAAAAPTGPKRILFSFKANGDEISRRFKVKHETDFVFDEFLEPLEPYRNELLILDNLHKRYGELGDGEAADNHQQGGSALAPWASGEGSFPIGGTDQSIGYVEGPSADYELGERVLADNTAVPHRHLVYRVGGKDNNIWNLHSHGGPVGTQNPIAPETDPYEAYARIFNFSDDPEAQAEILRRIQKKQSALDLLIEQTASLENRLGSEDRQRMNQHTEALRDIERALQNGAGGVGCAPLDLGGAVDPYADESHEIVGKLFQRISAMAFACDLTRVVQFNWSGNTSNRVYGNLGMSEGHHDISHQGSDASFIDIRKINTHLWTLSTALFDELKALPEGDGTVWDNTLVVHWNELGQGDVHSINDNMVIFAGGAQGYFKMGRYLDFGTDAGFSDMLCSCFHYMGFEDVELFGDQRLASGGPLPGLV